MPKGKNFMVIHPLVVQLCELVEKNKKHIEKHLGRNKKDKSLDHVYIDSFQDALHKDLIVLQPNYNWEKEKKANGRTVGDRVDIYGNDKHECCIIEIDATRIDQIAQKFVSRLAIYGLNSRIPVLYVALLYEGSGAHKDKESCVKYIRFCYDIIRKCVGKESSVVGIYTDGNVIEVIDNDIQSSFLVTSPDGRTAICKSMVDCAKLAIQNYINVNHKKIQNFNHLHNVFGQAVSNTCQASKNILITAPFGDVYVSKDWREYGDRGIYWDEFVKRCKKVKIKIEKRVVRYQSGQHSFIYV